ncbi:tyrosine-protein phosphatase [Actinomadura madurae]|nr:tyrosine-protein phosphatase [Actinomadura madurae]
MDDDSRWIELDGAVNARDLGGLPTTDGRTTRRGRVLRSDNLQDLTVADVRLLLDGYALKNVIDLRSDAEVRLEGPGPLTRVPSVTIHQLSLFPEGGRHTDVAADVDVDKALPWQERPADGAEQDRSIGHYLGYLTDRGDSVVAALRVMTRTDGSALVHCAAGQGPHRRRLRPRPRRRPASPARPSSPTTPRPANASTRSCAACAAATPTPPTSTPARPTPTSPTPPSWTSSSPASTRNTAAAVAGWPATAGPTTTPEPSATASSADHPTAATATGVPVGPGGSAGA